MGFIEHMKWWQWMIVSLLVGAVLGFINTRNVAELPLKVPVADFEKSLMKKPLEDHGRIEPWITDIKLFPPQRPANSVPTQMVTFMWRNPKWLGTPAGEVYQPCSTVVELPFVPRGSKNIDHLSGQNWPGTDKYVAKEGDTWRSIVKSHYGAVNATYLDAFTFANLAYQPEGKLQISEAKNPTIFPGYIYYLPWSPTSTHTLRDFLDEAAKVISTNAAYKTTPNWVHYRYQWWHDPKYAYWLFMSCSFVGIGVIWPLLMHFLVAGGLGRAQPDDYDLSRFKGGKDSKQAAAAVVTDEDRQQLQELEANLEASLKASGTTLTTANKAGEKSAAPVKQLKAGPLDAAKIAPPPEEKKDFKGEFYPVARPGGKSPEKKD